MVETWDTKETATVPTKETETVYEIKDTITVRTVSKTRLEQQKVQYEEEIVRIQERIAILDADLAKIVELEKVVVKE